MKVIKTMGWFKSEFWHDVPGHRFRRRYRARQESQVRPLDRVLRVAGGMILVVVGIALLILPGPGIPPLLIGAALLAGESLTVARWLDGVELKVRNWRKSR